MAKPSTHSVPSGFKLHRRYSFNTMAEEFVVTKGDRNMVVSPGPLTGPSEVQSMIMEAVEVIMQEEEQEMKSETRLYGEAIGADAVITGEGEEYIKGRTYGTSLTQQMREAMDRMAKQMMDDREREKAVEWEQRKMTAREAMMGIPPAYVSDDYGATWKVATVGGGLPIPPTTISFGLIVAGYKAAAECDYLTTLEVDDRGVVIVMKDGEDYTTSLVPWSVLATWPVGLANPIIDLIAQLARLRRENLW